MKEYYSTDPTESFEFSTFYIKFYYYQFFNKDNLGARINSRQDKRTKQDKIKRLLWYKITSLGFHYETLDNSIDLYYVFGS